MLNFTVQIVLDLLTLNKFVNHWGTGMSGSWGCGPWWVCVRTSHVSVVRDWQRAPCQPAAQRQCPVTLDVLLDSVLLLLVASNTYSTESNHKFASSW